MSKYSNSAFPPVSRDNDELVDRLIADVKYSVINGDDIGLLRLLISDDRGWRRVGLRIFSELGTKAESVISAALRSAKDDDYMVRASLMDGLLACISVLTYKQIAEVLDLASDDNDLVLEKMVVFLGALDDEQLRRAVDARTAAGSIELNETRHSIGEEVNDPQAYFDRCLDTPKPASTFKFGNLLRLARRGMLVEAPIYEGESYLAIGVCANISRIVSNADRRSRRLND